MSANPFRKTVESIEEYNQVKAEQKAAKEATQEVTPVVEAPKTIDTNTVVIKTELDAYIKDVINSQSQTLSDVEVRDFNFDRPSSVLTLPAQIEKILKQRQLTPRWINKKKRAIDHAVFQRGWIIVNRTFFPTVPKHIFTANGTVEVGDCILAFMPESQAAKLRNAPRQESLEKIKNLPMDRYKDAQGSEKIGFYKPAYNAEPDGQVTRQDGRGISVQPDVATETEN